MILFFVSLRLFPILCNFWLFLNENAIGISIRKCIELFPHHNHRIEFCIKAALNIFPIEKVASFVAGVSYGIVSSFFTSKTNLCNIYTDNSSHALCHHVLFPYINLFPFRKLIFIGIWSQMQNMFLFSLNNCGLKQLLTPPESIIK